MPNKDYLILLIDDADDYCTFVSKTLSTEDDYQIITCSSLEESLKVPLIKTSVDLILLDIYFPSGTSIAHIPDLINTYPNADIVMITVSEDFLDLILSIEAGASGYILKSYSKSKLIDSISIFQNDGAYISPYMSKKLIDNLKFNKDQIVKTRKLSSKEIEVLRLFSKGYSYEEAALELEISIDGLRSRTKSLYKKLQVNSKVQAVNFYVNNLVNGKK